MNNYIHITRQVLFGYTISGKGTQNSMLQPGFAMKCFIFKFKQ